MYHHMAAFFGSVAASQTDSTIAPVNDGALTIGVSGLLLPDTMRIHRVFSAGLGQTQGRINVPSLRAVTLPRINPVNAAAFPVDDAPILIYGDRGPRVLRSEGFSYQVTTDATAGPNNQWGFFSIYPRFTPAPMGDITTVRWSSTITLVAGVWGLGAVTLEQDLPAGRYSIVGCDAIGSTVMALRMRFSGASLYPGIIVQQAAGQFFLNNQRFGAMGAFGEFDNSLPPQIEAIGTAGAVTITGFWDLIKVA